MTPAYALIVDAVRAGVLLIAQGDRLRFKALGTMPVELAERIKAHRADVLALLSPHVTNVTGTETHASAVNDDGFGDGVSGDRPAGLLAIVRDAFNPLVLEVVDVRHDATWPTRSRNRAARLIRDAHRRQGRAVAVELRDAWHERMAICTIDGGLSEADAEAVALTELEHHAERNGP